MIGCQVTNRGIGNVTAGMKVSMSANHSRASFWLIQPRTPFYLSTFEAVRSSPLLLRAPPLPLTITKVTVPALCRSRI